MAVEVVGYFDFRGDASATLNKLGCDSNSGIRCCLSLVVSCTTNSVGGKRDPSFVSGKFISFPIID